jgi:hypothetical protein
VIPEPGVIVNGEAHGLNRILRADRVSGGLCMFERYARRCLIAQLAEREGVLVGQGQMQTALDEWRYANDLERVEDTDRWLASRGVTLEDVAQHIECDLLSDALERRVTADRVEEYFAQHRLAFDRAEIYWIRASGADVLDEARTQVAEEGVDFGRIARARSEDDRSRPSGGYLGRLRREDLPKGIAPLVFGASPGGLVGPLRVPGGYGLYLVQSVYAAELDEGTQATIRSRLFNEWLAVEIRNARVEYPCLTRPAGDVR